MTRLQGKIEYNVNPYQDILDLDIDEAEKARLIQERGDKINKQIDSDLMKDLIKNYAGAAIQIGSAAIPFTGGGRLAVEGAKLLKPMVGKAIANTIAKGTIAGAKSGAVEGFGRGLMEDENPLLTAAYDSVLGTLFGAGAGAVEGKITQKMTQKALKDADKTTLDQYYDDYIADLTNKTNAMADYRGLKQGARGLNRGQILNDLIRDENNNPLVLLHGTGSQFDKFDKNMLGFLTGAKSAKKGFWFTNGEDTAKSYAEYAAKNSELNKLLKKQQAMEKMPLVDWNEYEKLTEEIEKLALNPNKYEPRIVKAHLDMNNPASYDAQGKKFMEIQNEINDFLENNPQADGFIINNLKDAVNPNVVDEAVTHYMVREPEQIKILDEAYEQFAKDLGEKPLKYRDEWVKIGNKDYRVLNLPKKDYGKILHILDTNIGIDDNIGDILTKYDGSKEYTFKKTGPYEYKFIKQRKIK